MYIKAMPETYDINELAQLTGISVRTARYWVAEGILPPPSGRGPAAVYGPGHRDRITLIRRLQDGHLPLAAIRAQLEALDDAGVAAALTTPAVAEPAVTAFDYVRQVLGKQHALSEPAAKLSTSAEPPATRTKRSTWERITLHPDIELHVRRPLARADQRRLETLLATAERLFTTDG